MLTVERRGNGLEITAECHSCGLPILNPADGSVAYRTMNEPRPQLLHQSCVRTHRKQHPRNWSYVKAASVFRQLGY